MQIKHIDGDSAHPFGLKFEHASIVEAVCVPVALESKRSITLTFDDSINPWWRTSDENALNREWHSSITNCFTWGDVKRPAIAPSLPLTSADEIPTGGAGIIGSVEHCPPAQLRLGSIGQYPIAIIGLGVQMEWRWCQYCGGTGKFQWQRCQFCDGSYQLRGCECLPQDHDLGNAFKALYKLCKREDWEHVFAPDPQSWVLPKDPLAIEPMKRAGRAPIAERKSMFKDRRDRWLRQSDYGWETRKTSLGHFNLDPKMRLWLYGPPKVKAPNVKIPRRKDAVES